LDVWNEAVITLAIEYSVQIKGEGRERLSAGENNLIVRSAQRLAEIVGKRLPPFHLDCVNRIPLSSGLGSSAAAKLTGLLGANSLMGKPLSKAEILSLATEMEGHPDNVAPALLGGLVVSAMDGKKVLARKVEIAPIHITVVLPDVHISTQQARAALPDQVAMKDAVHNISRTVLVMEAFRSGDFDLLGQAMTDTLHQPYRLQLIPGAQEAMDAARKAGAAAVALSGAGPSLIAFSSNADEKIGETMQSAFQSAGCSARVFVLNVCQEGASAVVR
jgi:homoserine kinase